MAAFRPRRSWGFFLLFTLGLGTIAERAGAQNYPARPIRLIVPQAPGSASDTSARIVAAELNRRLGQQIVVDNRPGGALTIGMDMTARAAPDGYTIGFGPVGALAISPNMMRKLPYDVLKDFAAVAQLAANQMLLAVSPQLPFKTVPEVINYARQNPGRLSNASSGNGTPGHVGFELLKHMTGTNIVHVPYKGGAAGIADLISGQVHLMMESQNSITPHARAGRVRGIAVTGAKRSTALPDLPTIAEAGVPGYEASTWNGIVAPAGVPKTIIVKLNAEINKALAAPALREKFAAIGAEPTIGTPEQFAELIRKENVKWADVVKRSGARID
jgi:tripartite-type tricarboxylate transporter receptor subunit TctC